MKKSIFRKFQKIHKILRKSFDFCSDGSSRVAAAGRSVEAGGARENTHVMRGGAAGVPESSSMLGVLLAMSLPIFRAIGGPQSIIYIII